MAIVQQAVFELGGLQRKAAAGDIISNTDTSVSLSATGNTTVTAALLAAKVINRVGATAAFTDTLDTATNLAALFGNVANGSTFRVDYNNTTQFTGTLAGGTGVTFTGDTTVGPYSIKQLSINVINSSSTRVHAVTTVNTSAQLTGLTQAQVSNLSQGMVVTGTGIPANTTITGLSLDGTVTISNAATASGTLVSVTFSPNIVVTALGNYNNVGNPLTGPFTVSNVNTVGATTITGAMVVGGAVVRGGTQAGSIIDTLDTVANILLAQGTPYVGQAWDVTFENKTLGNWTITMPGGATVVPSSTIIGSNTFQRYRVRVTSATAISLDLIETGRTFTLAKHLFTTSALGTHAASSFELDGADFKIAEYTGQAAITVTTLTAAQMLAVFAGLSPGFKWVLRIVNRNSGTLTLTGGTGVTITGVATVATLTWTDYACSITTDGTTATFVNIGSGVA